jgi:serine/threonine-protein kinase RsbW
MADEPFLWENDITIPSDLVAARRVQEELLDRLGRNAWSQRDVYAVRLAMEEALVNAVVHGNQRDPAKQVHLRLQLGDALLRVQIRDEGPGFDPEALPDPTDPDHIECPSGRGVMLIRHFMSRVAFSDGGRTITMERRRDGA